MPQSKYRYYLPRRPKEKALEKTRQAVREGKPYTQMKIGRESRLGPGRAKKIGITARPKDRVGTSGAGTVLYKRVGGPESDKYTEDHEAMARMKAIKKRFKLRQPKQKKLKRASSTKTLRRYKKNDDEKLV
jgi:hypothetical protein|tara:strand:- start:59 stop:451 length:393 start_codon:yes stop_codon:yes gene_type:complete